MKDVSRRSQQVASALNLLGAIASSSSYRTLLKGASASQVRARCERAVALVSKMADNFSGASVEEVKSSLEQLSGALALNDEANAPRHAAAALKALGFQPAPASGRKDARRASRASKNRKDAPKGSVPETRVRRPGTTKRSPRNRGR